MHTASVHVVLEKSPFTIFSVVYSRGQIEGFQFPLTEEGPERPFDLFGTC